MKKMMYKYLIYVFILVLVIAYIPNLIPVKYAISQEKLKYKENYIICEAVAVTGFDWQIIGGSNNYYKKNEYVQLVGNTPDQEYGFSIEYSENKYAFYGKFIGDGEFDGDKYRIFEVSNWDIIYPVRRSSIRQILAPKGYLNIYDIYD